MATEFIMPKLGLTMEEGTITEWLADDGVDVAAGSPVLRIETDKTETDVEATGSGRLHRLGQVGDTFTCGALIGWFLGEGEAAPRADRPAGRGAAPDVAVTTQVAVPAVEAKTTARTGRIIASPLAKRLAEERHIDLRTVDGSGPGGRIVSEDLDDRDDFFDGVASGPAAKPVGVAATAAARHLADLLGIDLFVVAPDPIEHCVTKQAVALHVRQILDRVARAQLPGKAAAPAGTDAVRTGLPAPSQPPTSTVRLSGVRGTIARRMHESLTQMAQLTLFMDADLDAVVADRERRAADGAAPSYTDYVIAAAARALERHRIVNSQITDEGVAMLPSIHVGMAVALDDGLIVPVIRDTVGLGLEALSRESKRLADAARSGTLAFTEIEGGTFSVSTLGMFGVDGFTPVINPPNTAILGVGRLRDDLVLAADGRTVTTKRLTLSLTWDHRAFDGAPAAAFCRSIVELLNDPASMSTHATAGVTSATS